MLTVAIIGYGYWGPNLVRNFYETQGITVKYLVDQKEELLAKAQARYPTIRCIKNIEDALKDSDVDAVVIATPTRSHFDLAMRALEAGKHVLIEKPMTETVEQAKTLIAEATKRGLTLMVDHTFIYSPAVRRVREMINSGILGDILYYDSTRINLGLFQQDVNVLWDLAVHDVSILSYWLKEKAVSVSATGLSHVDGKPENTAYMTLQYGSKFIAHINVNWLSPVKLRRTILGGSKKMIVYDDLEPTEKIKIYDRGITVQEDSDTIQKMRVGYRMGDMLCPQIENGEALSNVAKHFMSCILNKTQPDTSGNLGLEVITLLEAASRSMSQGGQPIKVSF